MFGARHASNRRASGNADYPGPAAARALRLATHAQRAGPRWCYLFPQHPAVLRPP